MGTQSPGAPSPRRGGSPVRKKPKAIPFSVFDKGEFPGLSQRSVSTEMYLHIRSEVQGKKMVNLNRFKLEHFLTKITKKWTKASFNRDGDLILKVSDEVSAKLLLATKTIGDYKVNVSRHATLNCSKGVIFCPDLIDMSEEEIKEGMCLFHKVKEIFVPKRMPKTPNGSLTIPTAKAFGLIIITFDQLEPPKQVNVGFKRVDVRPYIPNPRRCRTCQMLGHTTKFCPTKQEVCGTCGQSKVENHACNGIYCVNCNSNDHCSTDIKCPKWMMNKELESMMVHEKLTKYEARKEFYSRYGDEKRYAITKNMTLADRLKAAALAQKVSMVPTQTTHTASPKRKDETSINHTTPITTTLKTPPTKKTVNINTTNEQDDGKSKTNNISSRLRLVKWEVREDDASYYLRNLSNGDSELFLDLNKFKKPNETTQERLNEVAQMFKSGFTEIKNVLAQNPKCDYIEIFMKDGLPIPWPIFGKLEDRREKDKEATSGASCPEVSSDEEMNVDSPSNF